MFETIITALETSVPATMLRGSTWVYPFVNTGHIIGIALLFGGLVPLDLKLLGMWPKVSLAPLLRVLGGTAAVGVGVAVGCGFLLFITRASAYIGSDIFIAKMVVVAVGLLNGLFLRTVASPCRPPQWVVEGRVPPVVCFAAALSLAAWTVALILGRLIGYIH